MKTLMQIFIGIMFFQNINYSQGELEIKPSNVDFKDSFHRIENVMLFNKEDQSLFINEINFNEKLFEIVFDRPTTFPIEIFPNDTINMDIILTNYFSVTSEDTADTISFFTSNSDKDQHLRVRIKFFDDDEKVGILNGKISNDSLSVENTEIYLYRNGQYLYDSVMTDSEGNFTINLPEGFYTAAAQKEGFYFTFYKNKFDIYEANQFFIDHDSTKNINWNIEKTIETNTILEGKIFNFKTKAAPRKGIIIVRKGKHTPTRSLNKIFEDNSELVSYSTNILSDGSYKFNKTIEPGFYYIQTFPDFYTPSFANNANIPAISIQDADSIYIGNNITNKDLFVVRDSAYGAGNISGKILINSNPAQNIEFILFAQNLIDNSITNYAIVDSLGNFNIINLPLGKYKLTAYQFGNLKYEGQDTIEIDITSFSINGIEINLLINSITSEREIPNNPILFPNYPNPFNPNTNIQFFLPNEDQIVLEVLNILGEKVTTIFEGKIKTGLHQFTFDGSKLSSGIYFIRLETIKYIKIHKAILLK